MNEISRRALLLLGGVALPSTMLGIATIAKEEAHSDLDKLDHERFMRLAIIQANNAPAYPFGAVVVNTKTNQVVASGWNRSYKNPIWHGEMTALSNCPDIEKGFDWREVCLYTTGEPCPMCQSAILWTRMPLVVYGSTIPFLQSQGIGQINIRASAVIDASAIGKCKIIGGVLESECNQLFIDSKRLRHE